MNQNPRTYKESQDNWDSLIDRLKRLQEEVRTKRESIKNDFIFLEDTCDEEKFEREIARKHAEEQVNLHGDLNEI